MSDSTTDYRSTSGRQATIDRETAETTIHVALNIDGSGVADISTGLGFFDHMLDAFTRHGRFDLTVKAVGDLEVDAHHTMEDTALAIGQAFNEALGNRSGIVRMGDACVPLDEALVQVVVDISGRPFASTNFDFVGRQIGEVPTEMVPHVLSSFATGARLTLHVRQLEGANDHHIVESAMKALARALDFAVSIDDRIAGDVPSTKGTLTV